MVKRTGKRPRTAMAFDAVGQLNPALARPLVITGRVPGGVKGKPYNRRRITTGGYSSVRTGQPSDFLQMQIQQQNTTIQKLQEDAKAAQLTTQKAKSELENIVTGQATKSALLAAADDIQAKKSYIENVINFNETVKKVDPAYEQEIDFKKLGVEKKSTYGQQLMGRQSSKLPSGGSDSDYTMEGWGGPRRWAADVVDLAQTRVGKGAIAAAALGAAIPYAPEIAYNTAHLISSTATDFATAAVTGTLGGLGSSIKNLIGRNIPQANVAPETGFGLG